GDHESERGGRWEVEAEEDGEDDRREEQRRAIVRKDGGDGGAEDHDQRKEASSVSSSPACDVQRSPCKESGLVENEGDDDQGDERECRIPDDAPDRPNIAPINDAKKQRHSRTRKCRPPDAQAPGLPNDHDESGYEDRKGEHGSVR